MKLPRLSRLSAALIMLVYASPFIYCLFLSMQNGERLYERQLVWYSVVLFAPVLVTYHLLARPRQN